MTPDVQGTALASAFAQAHRTGRTPASAQPNRLDPHHPVGGPKNIYGEAKLVNMFCVF